jgi:hypothetical protein
MIEIIRTLPYGEYEHTTDGALKKRIQRMLQNRAEILAIAIDDHVPDDLYSCSWGPTLLNVRREGLRDMLIEFTKTLTTFQQVDQ